MTHSLTIPALRHYLLHQSLPAMQPQLPEPCHPASSPSPPVAPSIRDSVLNIYAQFLGKSPGIKLEDFLEHMGKACQEIKSIVEAGQSNAGHVQPKPSLATQESTHTAPADKNTDSKPMSQTKDVYQFSMLKAKMERLLRSRLRREALECIFQEAQQKKMLESSQHTMTDLFALLVMYCQKAHAANKYKPIQNMGNPAHALFQYSLHLRGQGTEKLELTIILRFNQLTEEVPYSTWPSFAKNTVISTNAVKTPEDEEVMHRFFSLDNAYMAKTTEECMQQLHRINQARSALVGTKKRPRHSLESSESPILMQPLPKAQKYTLDQSATTHTPDKHVIATQSAPYLMAEYGPTHIAPLYYNTVNATQGPHPEYTLGLAQNRPFSMIENATPLPFYPNLRPLYIPEPSYIENTNMNMNLLFNNGFFPA